MLDEHFAPDVTTSTNRQKQIAQLYVDAYGELLSLASDYPTVTAEDANLLLEDLARNLAQYPGPPDSEKTFLTWAGPLVIRARTLCAIQKCDKVIASAIRRTLGYGTPSNSLDDFPETIRELIQDTYVWCLENLDALAIPGKASLSTRLFQRATWIAMAWRKKQIVRRDAVKRGLFEGRPFHCEAFSHLEMASMRADEHERETA
jgi:hypothetical protein